MRANYIAAIILIGTLAGCGTDSSSGNQGSSSSTAAAPAVTVTNSGGVNNSETYTLRISDAPIDGLTRVVVTFVAVELRQTSGGWIKYTYDTPQQIDLLSLQGTANATLLGSVPVEAGDYNEIRFIVDGALMANFVELAAGGTQNLQIPGGAGSGMSLSQNFTIPAGVPPNFVVDIDLRQSVLSPGMSGNYQLMPVWSLVDTSMAGHIRGTVDMNLLVPPLGSCSDNDADTFNAAYVFSGHGVTPDDIDNSAGNPEPVATTIIKWDATVGGYLYEAAFLKEGDYTIAFTCNADIETLNQNEDLLFFGTQDVTVIANNTIFL